MRSYIILGIYSLIIAAFFHWEASIFVMLITLLIEVIILILGFTIVSFLKPREKNQFKSLGTLIMTLPIFIIYLLMVTKIAVHYHEINEEEQGLLLLQGFYLNKTSLIVISICLGFGYLTRIRELHPKSKFIEFEKTLLKAVFQLFVVGYMAGMASALIHPASKWFGIAIIIIGRTLIEVWLIRKKISF